MIKLEIAGKHQAVTHKVPGEIRYCRCHFTNSYGDITDEFYEKMEDMFENALMDIVDFGLQEQFVSRCEKIIEETADMGWGFHDTIGEIFYDYFKSGDEK